MKKNGNVEHLIVAEMDSARAEGISFTAGVSDLLLDIKFLMREYYIGTINQEGNSLKIALSNGQEFWLFLEERFS